MSIATSKSTLSPFQPHHRNPYEKVGDEVGYHEGAAAVPNGASRKAKEVTEPYCVACHRQNQANPRCPSFPLTLLSHLSSPLDLFELATEFDSSFQL